MKRLLVVFGAVAVAAGGGIRAALGEQFLAGMVVVDPKKAVTCRWCSSGPLCRRYETSSTSAVMEDGDASDL
jgi:hypothetical protein